MQETAVWDFLFVCLSVCFVVVIFLMQRHSQSIIQFVQELQLLNSKRIFLSFFLCEPVLEYYISLRSRNILNHFSRCFQTVFLLLENVISYFTLQFESIKMLMILLLFHEECSFLICIDIAIQIILWVALCCSVGYQ